MAKKRLYWFIEGIWAEFIKIQEIKNYIKDNQIGPQNQPERRNKGCPVGLGLRDRRVQIKSLRIPRSWLQYCTPGFGTSSRNNQLLASKVSTPSIRICQSSKFIGVLMNIKERNQYLKV